MLLQHEQTLRQGIIIELFVFPELLDLFSLPFDGCPLALDKTLRLLSCLTLLNVPFLELFFLKYLLFCSQGDLDLHVQVIGLLTRQLLVPPPQQ